ncbi:MAG: transposase [Clostridiales bacterium]|nr:transposase [Clostridiales bacterium]
MFRQRHSKITPKWNRFLKKIGKQSIGKSRGGLTTKIHLVTASDRSVVDFALSGRESHDLPKGIKLIGNITHLKEQKYLLTDKAYEGENMHSCAENKGYIPIVPPKSNRKDPLQYDKERYKQRNEMK